MVRILCIETGSSACTVALSENGMLKTIKELHEQEGNHARNLSILIQEVLALEEIKATDLSAVAIGKGPGSYTGLRIGVSTAKGICYAANIPLIAINSLHALAQGAIEHLAQFPAGALICTTIDARRMEIYTAVFNQQLECIMDTQALVLTPESFGALLLEHPVIFLGNGIHKVKSILSSPRAHFMESITPSARFMIPRAHEMFNQKKFEDVACFEPYYLKDFVAIKPLDKILRHG